MEEHSRHLSASVIDALDNSRAVVLHGPRQSGKTTLAQRIAADRTLEAMAQCDNWPFDTQFP